MNALWVVFGALGTAIAKVLRLLCCYEFTLMWNILSLHGVMLLSGCSAPILVCAFRWNGLFIRADVMLYCRVNSATVSALPLYTLVSDLLVP